MIKEIALRKLASEEGVNPYGVGALGAAGLTGFGYSPLFEKVVTKDLDNKYDRASKAWNKTYDSYIGYRKNVDKIKEDIHSTIKARSDAIDRMIKSPAKNTPAFKSYIGVIDSELADLEKYKDLLESRHVDRLASRLKRIQSLQHKLLDRQLKSVTPIAVGTKLIAPLATLGLGGKYLYDKFKD